MPKYTDEELSMLTPEERDGYDEGQDFDEGEARAEATPDAKDGAQTVDETPIVVTDDADDKAAKGAEAGDGKTGDDATVAAAADDDAGKKAAEDQAAAAAAAAQAADTQTQDAADDDTPHARRPLAMTQLPEDFDAQVAKIGTDKDALVAQFDEGDLTMAEYHKQLDDLNRKERELERLKDRVDYETRSAADHWVNVDVAGFLEAHPEYNANPMLLQLLDAEVQKLQRASGEQFDPSYLTTAHKTISDGMPAMFANSDKASAAKPAKREIPNVPTLANVPAADVDRPADGKFAVLDRLAETDPIAFEEALDKMPADQREEYLAS